MNKNHAIIFDMDGVLIDSEGNWKAAITEVYATLNVDFPIHRSSETMGMRLDEATQYWYEEFQWKGPSVEEIVNQVMERVVYFVRTDGHAKPGAIDAVRMANEWGAQTAIASSSYMHIIEAVVETLDLGQFNAIHSSEHAKKGKPAPDIYLRTAKELGIDPTHCIVIEDAPKGVTSAKAAGMKCIAVPDTRWVTKEQVGHADIVIDTLEDFSLDMVQSLYS